MVNIKKKSTISEDLADLAVQKSDHARETGKMKDEVNLRKKNRKKCTIGKSINPEDRRSGNVKEYSKFEIAVETLLRGLKGCELEKRSLSTYSDIVLVLVSKWKKQAIKLERRGLIDPKQLRDAKGKVLITSPWIVVAIEKLFGKEFAEIYCHRSKKDEVEITRANIRAQASSIFSSIIKVFVELGLAKKVPAAVGGIKTYFIYEKTYRFSVEELHHLFIEGRKLCARKKMGKFGDDEIGATIDIPKEKHCGKCQRVEIPTENNEGKVVKKSIEIKPNGTILIDIFYE